MAIDTASYVGFLNPEIPTNKDPVAEGAAQIRAIKTAIQQTFPNMTGPVTATTSEMNATFNSPGIPIGTIAMWMGVEAPDGWAICDGGTYNGFITTDMRGRIPFGIMEGSDINVPGQTVYDGNGYEDITQYIDVRPHALSESEIPSHYHLIGTASTPTGSGGDPSSSNYLEVNGWNGHQSSAFLHGVTVPPDSFRSGNTGEGLSHSHEAALVQELDVRGPAIGVNFIVYVGSASGTGNSIPTVTITPQTGSLPDDGTPIVLTALVSGTPEPTLVWRVTVNNDAPVTLTETTATLNYIPTSSGTYTFTCIAVNDEGSNSASSVWVVGTAPIISNTTEPADTAVGTGYALNLYAYASGANTWRWQFSTESSTAGFEDIASASGAGGKAHYYIPSINLSENIGYYRCVFSNDFGSTNSRVSNITEA